MNAKQRRIQILRESMLKIARTLAGKGINITQAGKEAFVKYSAVTGKPERVNIPMIPDDASDDLINATHGFLDHEIGHVMFTDHEYIRVAAEANCHSLFNMLEDTYVERMMQMEFTGSGYNLNNMRSIFISRFINPEFEKLKEKATTETVTQKEWWSILAVCAIRAYAGQAAFEDYMADKWELISKIKEILDHFKKDIPDIISSSDSCELAMDIKKMLMGEPPKKSDKDEEGEEDESENESDPSDDIGGESKKSDEESPTNDDTFVDDSDDEDESDSEEGDEDDSDPEDDEESDDEDYEEPEQLDEDDEPEDTDDDSSGGDSDEPEEDDDLGDSDDGDSDSDDDDPADNDEDDDSDGDSSDDDAGDESSPSSGGDAGDGDADDSYDSDEMRDDELGRKDEEFQASTYNPPITFEENEIDELTDSDVMDKMVSELAASCIANTSDYKPFTRDMDIIERPTLSASYSPALAEQVDNKVKGMVGVLAKNLERAFRAANRSRWESGKKSGRLNGAALGKLLTNDPRVMRTREEMKTRDVAVTLLIDQSGSMSGGKMQVASEAAWALAETMNKLGLPVEVLGFTTTYARGEMGEELEQELREASDGSYYGSHTEWDRYEPILIPVYKDFNERFGNEQKARLADLAHNNQPMRNNIDGESLLYAAERLRKRTEPGKVMIVLSDGQPAGGGDMRMMNAHLKNVVADLNKEGINTVGIGINTTCVESFYPKHVSLDNTQDLAKEVMHHLREAILAKAT